MSVVSVRLIKDTPFFSDKPIRSPEDAVQLLGEHMCELDREVICVINLRTDGIPINCNFVSMGAVNETIAHPREILKSTILSNATSMIIVHNHPSGNLQPSKCDTTMTDRMLKTCELLGIPLIDHIIVGGDNQSYFSFKEKDVLHFTRNAMETDYKKIEFKRLAVAESEQDNESQQESAVQEEHMAIQRRHNHR
ncbi:MAG: JAB domain-containing protein [bacterium]|nr:JAB domain-containing protein [bacterium]